MNFLSQNSLLNADYAALEKRYDGLDQMIKSTQANPPKQAPKVDVFCQQSFNNFFTKEDNFK